MAVNLVKGQKVNLVKASGGSGLREIRVGLGWDEVEQKTGFFASLFSAKKPDIDCDASVILCGADGKLYLAHTLNNTVVAPPRMLIAFLENHLQADGSVTIPEVLRPYMGGTAVLKKKN